ncbi:TARBP1 [Scenedesmus sp. PABB004]|nr:TARBP1 [Scenedesmus sp. PABB004]
MAADAGDDAGDDSWLRQLLARLQPCASAGDAAAAASTLLALPWLARRAPAALAAAAAVSPGGALALAPDDGAGEHSALLAELVAQLVARGDAAAADLLVQSLLPQLLACGAECGARGLRGHWAGTLCGAAAALCDDDDAGVADAAAAHLAALGWEPGARGAHGARRGALALGDAAAMLLVAAAAARRRLSGGALRRLLACALRGLACSAGELRGELQAVLLPELLAAAAEQPAGAGYAEACAQLVATACGGADGSSAGVADALETACRLQLHVLAACAAPGGGAAATALHGLMLRGLAARHAGCRSRALHLLAAAAEAGCAPAVPGWGERQWAAFAALFRALDERVLHLVQPVWAEHWPQLQLAAGGGSGAGVLVRWAGALLRRAAAHSNVSVRRLGLAGLLELPPDAVGALASGGWAALQALLLELLEAFENEKLVPAPGAASRSSSHSAAALQGQLAAFLAGCLAAAVAAVAPQQQQQGGLAAGLVTSYLDRAAEVAARAPTAAALLGALADAAAAASGGGAVPLCALAPQQLLAHVGGALAQAQHLHPAHLRPGICRSLLRLVPLCADARDAGAHAALTLLSTAGVPVAVRTERFVEWLDAALCAPGAQGAPDPQGAAAPTQLEAWLAPLAQAADGQASGAAQGLPQQGLLRCLGAVSTRLSAGAQRAVGAALAGGAAAVGAARGAQLAAAPSLAALACGCVAALRSTPGGDATLAGGLAQLVPALLQHHASACLAQQAYDAAWSDWLAQLLEGLLLPAGEQAQELELQLELQRLQQAARAGLAAWAQRLEPDLAAAAADGAALDQQLLALSTAQLAVLVLPSGAAPAADAPRCLQHLCRLQPAAAFSLAWQASAATRGGAPGRGELSEALLVHRARLVARLVAGAGEALDATTRRLIFDRRGVCLEDLEWSAASDAGLAPLLRALAATAPFELLPPAPGAPAPPGLGAWGAPGPAASLQGMLALLAPLLRGGSGRRSGAAAAQLVGVAFNAQLFNDRGLRSYVEASLIPVGLAHGGARLSVAVMAHLSGVLAPRPALLLDYAPCLIHMAAFSLFAPRVDGAAALAQQHCDAGVLLPARVVCCAFLARLARSGRHAELTRRVLLGLLDIAQAAGGPYAWLGGREAGQGSAVNAVKVAVWQALCLLAPHAGALADEALERGWACLLQCHAHTNIRPHVQLFLLTLLTGRPPAVERYLLPALASFSTTSYQVRRRRAPRARCASARRVPPLTPPPPPRWQALLHVVLGRDLPALEPALGPEAATLLRGVWRFLEENEETAKLRQRQALVDLENFDLANETSLEGVFGVSAAAAAPVPLRARARRGGAAGTPPAARPGPAPRRSQVREAQLEQLLDGEGDAQGLAWHVHVRDRLPLDLLRSLPGALKAVGGRNYARGGGAAAPDGDAPASDEEADDGAGGGGGGGGGGADESGGGGGAAMLQFRPRAQAPLFDDDAAERADALAAGRAVRPGLVVVASLLTNLPNLAGLCRTCESLGVEALVLANRAVTATEAFKRQSVTSERWLRLLEVSAADLPTFLAERRTQGYTLVGVEQATGSVPLQRFAFPRRCVLLLGNEQCGVPAALLHELDACVEIPMLGVTRSLNAHVSGALVAWQYTTQWLPGRGADGTGARA